MTKSSMRWLGIAGLLLALAGCANPYGPASNGGAGFTDRKIGPNRYSVDFRGNGNTSSELVANMYLYRCAELTLQNKFDVFLTLKPEDASVPAPWPSSMSEAAGAGDAPLTEFKGGGGKYIPIYVPGHTVTVTVHTMRGIIHTGRYADVPSQFKVWDARAVIKALEPVVKGTQGRNPLSTEQLTAVARVNGRGKGGTSPDGMASSGTTMDDLRRLLVQP
jgi:hypothetical protein